ncbi:cupin domain-containing protein [Prolixibacteraceae bacterium JC049]|nr:cupin domain-containing protein [Prolixibacteraceae bacterium JC049]
MKQVFRYSNRKEVLKTDKTEGHFLATTQDKDFVELLIEAEGEVAAHPLPIEVTFYVISGEGTLEVDGASVTMKQGDMATVSANAHRGWRNNNTEPLKLLVIKAVS